MLLKLDLKFGYHPIYVGEEVFHKRTFHATVIKNTGAKNCARERENEMGGES